MVARLLDGPFSFVSKQVLQLKTRFVAVLEIYDIDRFLLRYKYQHFQSFVSSSKLYVNCLVLNVMFLFFNAILNFHTFSHNLPEMRLIPDNSLS